MISAILPSHDADTIALDFGVFIAERARTYRVSQAAILSALNPLMPSQPNGPAAVTSIAPQPDVQAEGVTSSSATPSPEPQPTPTPAVQMHRSNEAAELSASETGTTSLAGVEGIVDRQPSKTSKSGEASASPASPPRGRPETTRAQVVKVHHAHPDWPSKLIAQHLSISEDAVRATASRKKLKLVSWWDYERAEAAKKAAGIVSPVQLGTVPSAPIEAVIAAALADLPPPTKAKPPTLQDRIIAVRVEHPDWPYRVVAKHLGAPKNSVQSYASILGFTWPSQAEYDAEKAASAPPVSVPVKAKTATLAERIKAHLVGQPDATLKDLSDALEVKQTSIGWAASKAGIELRKYTAEERSAAVAKAIQTKKAETLPAVAPGAIHLDLDERVLASPSGFHRRPSKLSGRFYLRDNLGRYVHQSLDPSPTSNGPLMTAKRVYAWFDNEQRYRGAMKKWPELAGMVQEAPEK